MVPAGAVSEVSLMSAAIILKGCGDHFAAETVSNQQKTYWTRVQPRLQRNSKNTVNEIFPDCIRTVFHFVEREQLQSIEDTRWILCDFGGPVDADVERRAGRIR